MSLKENKNSRAVSVHPNKRLQGETEEVTIVISVETEN